jgi:hypothetical protein
VDGRSRRRQGSHLSEDLARTRRLGGFGRLGHRNTAAFAHDLLQSIALFRFEAAQLVFDVDPVLARKL